jgi:hypothetical protein
MTEIANNPSSAEPASSPVQRKRWSTPRLILAQAEEAGKYSFNSSDIFTGLYTLGPSA